MTYPFISNPRASAEISKFGKKRDKRRIT